MSSNKQKIGGEYGEVRANIDGDKLNVYIAAHVPVVATPVNIKQFKVCCQRSAWSQMHLPCLKRVW